MTNPARPTPTKEKRAKTLKMASVSRGFGAKAVQKLQQIMARDVNHVNKTKEDFIANETGRGLVAEVRILHGQSIIEIPEPFAVIPENSVLETHCYYCFKDGKLSRCSGCGAVKYCGTSCQKTSWKRHHKIECPAFKDIKEQGHGVLPTVVRAVIRVLQHHKTGLKLDPKWVELVSHHAEFMADIDRRENVLLQSRMAVKYANLPSEMVSVATAILCRIEVNGFHITAPDGTPLGLCFEPTLSLANHSCVPNAFISCDGRKISLRALRSIEKGTEITIAYVDPTMPLVKRRSQLQSHYFFECLCVRCVKDFNVYESVLYDSYVREIGLTLIEDVRGEAGRARRLINEHRNSGGVIEVDEVAINTAIKLTEPRRRLIALKTEFKKYLCVGQTMLVALTPCPQLIHEIYLTYLQAGAFAAAFIVQTCIVFNIDPFLFPEPWHPSRVESLYALYKLLKIVCLQPQAHGVHTLTVFSDKFPEAFLAFHILTAILSSVIDESAGSHGSGSRFVQEIEKEMKELEKLSSATGEIQFSKIRSMDVAGRQQFMKQMKEIAKPGFVLEVMESVDLA